MKRSKLIAAILCILLPLIVGSLSGLATVSSLSNWYAFLNKPSFNPPDYLFGPVWTVLYFVMGISLFLIWKSPTGKFRNQSLTIFIIQLLLNFAWSFIFFYFRQTGWAFVDIIMLWSLIVYMILIFYKINRTAALIQIPYLLWVSFASVLNAAIWILNK